MDITNQDICLKFNVYVGGTGLLNTNRGAHANLEKEIAEILLALGFKEVA